MLKPHLLFTLLTLAELEEELRGKPVTTYFIAEKLRSSQQTASKRLIELEKLGMINRFKRGEGELITVSSEGLKELNFLFMSLKRIFEPSVEELVFRGKVFTGFGEGAYYVSKNGYLNQFVEKLGFRPYPGTLNVKLEEAGKGVVKSRELLKALKPIVLQGFESDGRSFGPVRCFKATVNGLGECALIEAHRTHYGSDVIEVISPFNLRRRLGLRDGDEVEVRVFSTPL
jgi:riboflavin kinase